MRFCLIGAGAIGGFAGARLALAGEDVTFLARGRTLAAIAAGGIRLRHAGGREERVANVRAIPGPQAGETFDVVCLALKAYHLGAVAGVVESLCHEDTVVIPMQNGVPFWYFNGHGGALAGRAVESVDPGGRIRDAIAALRIVGCVVYVACESAGPGHVVHVANERFVMGEPDGRITQRVQRIAAAFERAGLQAPLVEDIRNEVWLKLWGNVSFNPISALTRATLGTICRDPHGRDLASQMMREAQAVAARFGIAFRMTIDKRIDAAARVGDHKTSMLQDVESGRALEVDALVGAVVELGRLVDVPTPTIDAIYRAVKLLGRGQTK